MGDLGMYLSRPEIECKCGCGLNSMDSETVELFDECRDFVGESITPSSGARCYAHNASIGSNDSSQHTKCRAIDLPVKDPKALYDYLCGSYPARFGFGLYTTFVHIDTRSGGPARW